MPFNYKSFVASNEQKKKQEKADKALYDVENYGNFNYSRQNDLNKALDAITNREKFSYDLNSDALYKQYKDQYTALGKLAMEDTIGQASAMTGGYGNSYAATAGNQAYQGYLKELNGIVPQLYQLALDKYQMEGSDLYSRYGILKDDRASEYGLYTDKYGRLVDLANLTASDAQKLYDREYGKYSDDRSLAHTEYWNDKNFAEQKRQYDEGVAYQKERDRIADEQWRKSYEASLSKSSLGGNSGDEGMEAWDYLGLKGYDEMSNVLKRIALDEGNDALADYLTYSGMPKDMYADLYKKYEIDDPKPGNEEETDRDKLKKMYPTWFSDWLNI